MASATQDSLRMMAEKATKEAGLALYDFEYVPNKRFLRIFIINTETRTALIEDCVKVDELMTPLMDSHANLPEGITLEVSSPGLFREMKTRNHFEWSTGLRVKIYLDGTSNLMNKKGKRRLEVLGTLQAVVEDANGFALEVLPEGEKTAVFITSNVIKKALTEPKI